MSVLRQDIVFGQPTRPFIRVRSDSLKNAVFHSNKIFYLSTAFKSVLGYLSMYRSELSDYAPNMPRMPKTPTIGNRLFGLPVPLLIGPDRWTGSPKMKGFSIGDLR